jgi:hypothetical protein
MAETKKFYDSNKTKRQQHSQVIIYLRSGDQRVPRAPRQWSTGQHPLRLIFRNDFWRARLELTSKSEQFS